MILERLPPRLSAAIVNAQHALAFRERRVRNKGRDPEQDPLVPARREEIRLLREQTVGAGRPGGR